MSDARTPGQVAYEAMGFSNWSICSDITRRSYERGAAAAVAHHVGPDRVVLDRADVLELMNVLYDDGQFYVSERIRKALK